MKKKLVGIMLIFLGITGILIWIKSNVPRDNISKTVGEKVAPKAESSLSSTVTSEALSSKREELRALLEADNASIEFHGIVVNEFGEPLKEVEVSWSIVKSGSFAPSVGLAAGATGLVSTSTDGRFSITNETGVTLRITLLSKSGYHEVNRTVRSYGYGSNSEPHQPDQKNPERFVMIENGGTRSVRKEIPLRFDWDGKIKEIAIPLPGRNETMILVPEIVGQKQNLRYSNWSIKIQMKNAQLITGKSGDARLAPIDGYLPEINLRSDTDGQWGIKANVLLYIKTTDGRFGEIMFSAYSDRGGSDPTGSLSIRWNPHGGRVFE
jgi:hypothetical protein